MVCWCKESQCDPDSRGWVQMTACWAGKLGPPETHQDEYCPPSPAISTAATVWERNRDVLMARVVLPGTWQGSLGQETGGTKHLPFGSIHLPAALSARPCLSFSSFHEILTASQIHFSQPVPCFLAISLNLPDACVNHSGT